MGSVLEEDGINENFASRNQDIQLKFSRVPF